MNDEDKAALKRVIDRIHDDLVRVGSVAIQLEESLEMLLNRHQLNLTPAFLQRVMEATAVELHGFYTGTEKIIERMVEYKTGSLPTGKSSHQDLLILAKDIGLLNESQYTFLRDLGAVRHFVRHSYGKELDLEALVKTTQSVLNTWPSLDATLTSHQQTLVELLNREH